MHLQACAGVVRVCLPSSKVSDCNSKMKQLEADGLTFECTAPPEASSSDLIAEIRCLKMIQEKKADFTVVGGERGGSRPYRASALLLSLWAAWFALRSAARSLLCCSLLCAARAHKYTS